MGAISFSGPAASIALIEQEVVRKRGWLDREHFLDLLGATNLVPGPNAVEMAIHIGFARAGWPGLFAAGTAFFVSARGVLYGIGFSLYALSFIHPAKELVHIAQVGLHKIQ